jgi:hypothetical protein
LFHMFGELGEQVTHFLGLWLRKLLPSECVL